MIEEFERHLRGTNLSENTVTSYLFAVRQFGERHDVVTKRNLKEHKAWLIEQYKPKTVNLRIRAINCYLESIGKDSWKLSSVKVQQKAFLENVISEADYIYFKNCLKRDDNMLWYFVIRFLAATGARVSELVQIKVEHIRIGHLDLYSKGGKLRRIYIPKSLQTSVYKGYKQDKIEMRGDRAEMSDFPLYLNTVAGGLDRRDQTIGGFSFVVKIYALPVVEIIGQLLYLLGRYGFNAQFGDCL